MNVRRKKVYKSKKFQNPYFRKKKDFGHLPSLSFNLKNKFFIIALIVFVFFIYLFFYSPLLKIKKINFSGNERMGESQLNEITWRYLGSKKFNILPQDNLILLDKEMLSQSLNKINSFNNIKIQKKLLHSLNIAITEKSYAFVWVEDDKYYYCDGEGNIISSVSPLDIKEKKYPIVQNNLPKKIFNNQTGISSEKINIIIELQNKIKEYIKDSQIEKFILEENENSVKVQFVSPPLVIFNFSDSIDGQINKLLLIKNEKLKDDFTKKTYIDLRFGDRVYFR